MPLRIAMVQTDHQLFRKLGTDSREMYRDLFEGRQVADLFGCRLDGVQPPVFVAILILKEEHMVVGVGPQINTNSAASVMGDRPGRREIIARGDSHVEYAINRRQPGEKVTVRADLDGGTIRIAEKQSACQQRGVVHSPFLLKDELIF